MAVLNAVVANLRALAGDENATVTRRLMACDSLAALGNIYLTKQTEHLCPEYVTPAERMRRSVIKLLRKMLRCNKYLHPGTPQAIRTRLLFISGVAVGSQFWQRKPLEGIRESVTKTVDPTVARLERLLAEHK